MPASRQPATTTPLPPGAAGEWCRVAVWLPGPGTWWAQVELTDEARGQIVRTCFLGPWRARQGGGERATLLHVPAAARQAVVHIFGGAGAVPGVEIRPLGRTGATFRLLWHGRGLLAGALAGDRRGRLGRLRAVLGQAPARRGQPPPYAAWIEFYESVAAPPEMGAAVNLQVAVTGADEAALAATMASLEIQTMRAGAVVRVRNAAGWAAVAAPWVLLLRAGELLAPDAIACFVAAIAAHPKAACVTADCDRFLADGSRADPLFKPGPDSLLLRSFLPLQGACALRWPASPPALDADAEAARRVLALLRPDDVVHVPRILTHISGAASPAPLVRLPPVLAPDFAPSVTALVPSALRAQHTVECLRHIVKTTAYSRFTTDVLIGDMAGARPDLLRRVAALAHVRVRDIALPAFNYAAANNRGAALADGELLLLLNDDVAPLQANWLGAMAAHMQDSRVGIVGARLLYGNGMVQHEGVIMGLAHLCEHAGRLRAGSDPGPHGIALLDRQVSAVTGACLLIRAELYRALGGMDESFTIALNDVDLCLRARQAGWRVVYCAHAELWHYESLSLGRHYAGARAALESQEVHRLRARWGGVIANDPFYSPMASLEPGREWQPGFPPRTPSIAAGAANTAATVC